MGLCRGVPLLLSLVWGWFGGGLRRFLFLGDVFLVVCDEQGGEG